MLRLLLEDKGGEQRDDLLGFVFRKDIFKDQFRQNQFVCRVNLPKRSESSRMGFQA